MNARRDSLTPWAPASSGTEYCCRAAVETVAHFPGPLVDGQLLIRGQGEMRGLHVARRQLSRSATIGSTVAARRAGITQANRAALTRSAAVVANVQGSLRSTP